MSTLKNQLAAILPSVTKTKNLKSNGDASQIQSILLRIAILQIGYQLVAIFAFDTPMRMYGTQISFVLQVSAWRV